MMAALTKVLVYVLQGEVTKFDDGLAAVLWESK